MSDEEPVAVAEEEESDEDSYTLGGREEDEEDEEEEEETPHNNTTGPSTRKKAAEAQPNEPVGTTSAQLPITTNLSARRIKATWPLLSSMGRFEIMRMINSELLSVLHSIHGEKAKQEFQIAYSALISRIEKKLHKVPVPPSTRKSHYEWDTIHNQNSQLESTLASMLEQNQHLEAEIEKETRELAKEKKYLKTVETNSKNQIGAMTKLGKKAQNIYRVQEAETRLADSKDDINLKKEIITESVELGDELQGEDSASLPSQSLATSEYKLTDDDPIVPVLRTLSAQLSKVMTATDPLNAILQECAKLEQEI